MDLLLQQLERGRGKAPSTRNGRTYRVGAQLIQRGSCAPPRDREESGDPAPA
ncbi:hypothetical protein [Actinomadura meyerae]|uniref:hypothetical protein n=1 Tax=Actinomadura meyerae TaxID=240840 RepID=UPI0015C68C83|nr:hypothetical protein [Actinomadura meyerae]